MIRKTDEFLKLLNLTQILSQFAVLLPNVFILSETMDKIQHDRQKQKGFNPS